MSNYLTLKAAISAVIKENNNHEITGQVLQTTLLAMVDSLAGGYLFKGIATPATVVGTPDENVFYIGGGGVYSNFGATPVHVPDGCIGIFTYNGSFENHIIPTGGVFDISAYNAVGGTPATYADLTAALGTNGANIPDYLRKGGMSVKFIQGSAPSSDNKYVQYRLVADEWSINTDDWAIAEEGVYVENPEFVYVKTDKDNKILWAIKKDGGIYYGADVPQQVIDYINEKIAEQYEDIVAFLNDLEKGDKTLQDLLNEKVDKEEGKSLIDAEYASTKSTIDNSEFIEVTIDSEDKVLEGIKKDGIKLLNLPLELQGTKFKTIDNPEWIYLLLDSESKILKGLRRDGTVYDPLNSGGASSGKFDEAIAYMKTLVANGGKSERILNILKNMPKGDYTKEGYSYHTTGYMSFHDDDTIDPQIPVSKVYNATPETRVPASELHRSGFASFLYPFTKSITERHRLKKKLVPNQTTHGYNLVDDADSTPINGNIVYGLAAEGQRTGLIGKVYSDKDEFDGTLNLCGQIASKLHYRCGWDIMCHSMTARYIGNSYWVESLNDPLVAQIEAAATPSITPNIWSNSYIHCDDNNQDYEYRIGDNNTPEWHLVSKHYIRPYLAKTLDANAALYFNPRYSEDFQVGEWVRRAKIAGLPFIDCGVNWGSSASKKVFLTRLKYINNWVAGVNNVNSVPFGKSTFDRIKIYTVGTNAWLDEKYTELKNAIDTAIANGTWIITNGHVPENYEANYYLNDIDYGNRRCDSYDPEWIVPLNQEELETIDENNYWEVPPARLGISSWAEWYPCPGTIYDMFMNVIEYAISKGIEFGSTEEGLQRYGNTFNIGFYDTLNYNADRQLASQEKDPSWNNYIIQGSDGSIKYHIV